ncbi:MAG: response regulator [Cellvibrionaceae bacterium]
MATMLSTSLSATAPQRFVLLCLLVLGLTLGLSPSLNAAPLLSLPEGQDRLPTTPYIDFLRDPSQLLLLEELLEADMANQFSPMPPHGAKFGRTNDAIWLRFNLAPSEQQLYLEMRPSTMDFVDVYIVDKKSQRIVSETHTGTMRVAEVSNSNNHLHIFKLPAHKHTQQVFIRLQSHKTLFANITLNSVKGITQYNLSHQLILGILFGGLLLMVFFNLMLGVLHKHKITYLLAGYILSPAIAIGIHSGHGQQFYPHYPWIMDNLLPLTGYMLAAFTMLFVKAFLNLENSSPKWNQSLRVLIYLCYAGMAASLFITIHTNSYVVVPMMVLSHLIALAISIRATYRNYRNAQTLLIASAINTLAMAIFLSNAYATIPIVDSYYETFLVALLIINFLLSHAIWKDHSRQLHNELKNQRATFQNDAAHNAETSTLRILSHELRNPIAGVIGLSELLLDSPLPPEQKDQVQSIRRSGHVLLKWLNRLTDWSKLQRNQVQLQKLPFNLSSLINEVVIDARSDAAERKSNFSVQLAPSLPEVLAGDPEHLKQLLQSLFDHALAHCWGSELELVVNQGGESCNWMFTLTVTRSDLDVEYASQLLKGQHSQPSTLSSTDRELIIANYLCQLMAGGLSMSRDSKGVVTYQLNTNIARHEYFQRHKFEVDMLQGKRILIVDDSATTRKLLHKQTESWSMRPSTTPSGTEALAMMRTMANLGSYFDLVILDYSMPTMNGMELAERISSDSDLASKSVLIMLTGASTAPDAETLKKSGICRVLEKPTGGNTLKLVFCEELNRFNKMLSRH